MVDEPDVETVATALLVSLGLLKQRLRQAHAGGELSWPELSALARLERGPTTSAALAKLEAISPQSMGATLAGLEARGLVERHPDPSDGRRVVLSVTAAGLAVLRHRRTARAERLARALAEGFTAAELVQWRAIAPLIERLAQGI